MATTDGQGLYPLQTAQYTSNLELLLQQKSSKLRGRTREGFHVGKMASPINQIGAVKGKAPAGRFAPKNRTDADFVRRWVFPQDWELDQLIDSFDELKTIVDPKSAYAEVAAADISRAWDDAIMAAACGTAQIGTDAAGLSSETFDTSVFQIASTFGSTAASGLTVPKIIEAKRILRKYHNDMEGDRPCMVIGSKQESDLLNQVQITSKEFTDRPVLMEGRVVSFLGFDIVVSERVPETTASTTRGILVWVKSGMYLGVWKDFANRVSIRNDLSSEPYDLYSSSSYGATRMQPGKVLRILCADTTGADITP